MPTTLLVAMNIGLASLPAVVFAAPATVPSDPAAPPPPLEGRMEWVDFDDMPLAGVLESFAARCGQSLFVNWDAMAPTGVTRGSVVTLHLRGVTLGKAITLALVSAAKGEGKLAYLLDGGVLTVSTFDDVERALLARRRQDDINRYAAAEPRLRQRIEGLEFNGVALGEVLSELQRRSGVTIRVHWSAIGSDLSRDTPVTVQVPGARLEDTLDDLTAHLSRGKVTLAWDLAANGDVVVTTDAGVAKLAVNRVIDLRRFVPHRSGASREDEVEAVIKLIEDAIAPESWRDNGGALGGMRNIDDVLVIQQTFRNHQRIQSLLTQMRDARRSREIAAPGPARPAP